jgi:hypothetical protein
MDPESVTGAMLAFTQVTNTLAGIIQAVRSINEAVEDDGKTVFSNLNTELINLQVAMMDLLQKQQILMQENEALRIEVNRLEKNLEDKGKMEMHYNAYWLRDEEGVDGPFWMRAWDNEKKLARMKFYELVDDTKAKFLSNTKDIYDYIRVPLDWLREEGYKHISECR